MGKIIFVETTRPFPEILIGNWYCIIVVDNCSRYYCSFFTKTKSQLPKKMEDFFEKMISCGTPVKYLPCDNAGEHQPKLQNCFEKEKVTLEYTTSHTTRLNNLIERSFAVIKERELEMLLNAKLNKTSQKILWVEASHTCKHVRNIMDTTGIEKFHSNIYMEKN